jgi:hypothetical protein
MRRGAIIAGGSLLVVCVGACNALTGIDELSVGPGTPTDPRELAREDSGAQVADASPSEDGAAAPDAADANAEASADGAPPLGFCASLSPAPDLCTDFDDAVFPGSWTIMTAGIGSALSTTAASRSGSRSVALASAGAATGMAYLTHTLATAVTTELVLGFSIRADQVRSGENELAVILLGSAGGSRYELQIELLDGGVLNLEEETPLADGTVPQTDRSLGSILPTGQWRSMRIALALGTTSSSITFSLEGAADVTLPLSAHLYKAAPTIDIGHNSSTTAPFALHYDDVFVRSR